MSDAAEVKPEAPELTLEREFAHPPEAVFRAWTETDALKQWMGPGEVKCPGAEMDASVGGAYVFPMISPDGMNPTARGVISEIVPNKKLRFSWAWDQEDGSSGQQMEVTIEFQATASGTRIVLHQTNLIDEEARDKHEHGWNGCCDKLVDYLAM